MRRWQLTGLVVGAAALLFTARPAQAQVWVGRPPPPVWPVPPVGVVPPPPVTPVPPIGVVPGPGVVGPGWGTTTYWAGRPTWAQRRAYRQAARRW